MFFSNGTHKSLNAFSQFIKEGLQTMNEKDNLVTLQIYRIFTCKIIHAYKKVCIYKSKYVFSIDHGRVQSSNSYMQYSYLTHRAIRLNSLVWIG